MTSKKRLLADMATMEGGGQLAYGSNETYGRRSFIYLTVLTPEMKTTLVDALISLGHRVDPGWTRQNKGVAVQVSYFKGWHWDE